MERKKEKYVSTSIESSIKHMSFCECSVAGLAAEEAA